MRELVAGIVEGEFSPGEMLPKEQALAARFDVSRGVAREVIRALQERGVVTVRHGLGARVTPEERWNVLYPDVLGAMLERPDGLELLREVTECRLIAEVEAVALAAERASEEDVAMLEEALARPRGRRDDGAAAEVDFHVRLVSASRNRPLVQMLRPVYEAMAQARDVVPRRGEAAAERRAILEAVRAHDVSAARDAARAHLEAVAASLRRRSRRRR
jgi:DNA-binding FadR family transcriptional regulator